MIFQLILLLFIVISIITPRSTIPSHQLTSNHYIQEYEISNKKSNFYINYYGNRNKLSSYNLDHKKTIKISDFNAIGDGISDDTDAFERAAKSDADIIIIPSGTYLLNKRIVLHGNQTWIGFGSPIIKKINKSKFPIMIFSIKNVSNITIDGLIFDGNVLEQTPEDIKSDRQKALIEIQGLSKNIQLKNCTIKNGVQWGLLLKGNIEDQVDIDGKITKKSLMPQSILLENIDTLGNLGINKEFIHGKQGATGIALVSVEDIKIIGGTSYDFFDIEPNTQAQKVTGLVKNRVFKEGADLADSVHFLENIFEKPSTLNFAVRITKGDIIFEKNIIKQNKKSENSTWAGVLVLSNNTSNTVIKNNKFIGSNMVGVALRSLSHSQIINNQFNIKMKNPSHKLIYNKASFNLGAIVMASENDNIRSSIVKNNKVVISGSYSGMAFYFPSHDQRFLQITENSITLNKSSKLGTIYYYGNPNSQLLVKDNLAHIKYVFPAQNVIEDGYIQP